MIIKLNIVSSGINVGLFDVDGYKVHEITNNKDCNVKHAFLTIYDGFESLIAPKVSFTEVYKNGKTRTHVHGIKNSCKYHYKSK